MDNIKKPIIVLDANAFITMGSISELGVKNRLVTTSDVIAELKDQKTRAFFSQIPFQIEEINFNDKSLDIIKDFARKTGDLGSLSDVDLELLALVHTLYIREDMGAKLRKDPPPLVQKEDLNNQYLSDSDSSSQEEEGKQNQTKQQQNTTAKQATLNLEVVGKKIEVPEENQWISVPIKSKKEQQSSDSDEDDEQAWITPKNYDKKMAEINNVFKEEVKQEEDGFSISLISADFAIQNIATQIGMRLLSLDGRKITSIRRFIWQCYLCWKQYKVVDNKIKICSSCGYNSLSKISYSVDAQGSVVLHRKKGWKPNEKILEWKERKLEQQEKKKKHQHQRRRKKPSIFEAN